MENWNKWWFTQGKIGKNENNKKSMKSAKELFLVFEYVTIMIYVHFDWFDAITLRISFINNPSFNTRFVTRNPKKNIFSIHSILHHLELNDAQKLFKRMLSIFHWESTINVQIKETFTTLNIIHHLILFSTKAFFPTSFCCRCRFQWALYESLSKHIQKDSLLTTVVYMLHNIQCENWD